MQLKPGEQSILAYFPNSTQATEAAKAINALGFREVQVDRVSRYGVSHNREINNPISGQAATLTGLVLFGSDTDQAGDDNTRILMAADPSVSGMAAHDYGLAGGKAFLLTVVAPVERVDEAVQLLSEKNAYF